PPPPGRPPPPGAPAAPRRPRPPRPANPPRPPGAATTASSAATARLLTCIAAELVRSSSVAVRRISTVLRIVLPIPSLTIDVAVKIVVLVIIIIVIDFDVAVVPIAISPVAAPSTPGRGAERTARTQQQGRPWHVPRISIGIVRIRGGRCTVDDSWIV